MPRHLCIKHDFNDHFSALLEVLELHIPHNIKLVFVRVEDQAEGTGQRVVLQNTMIGVTPSYWMLRSNDELVGEARMFIVMDQVSHKGSEDIQRLELGMRFEVTNTHEEVHCL